MSAIFYPVHSGSAYPCGLNASSLVLARKDGLFEQYGYTSATDATSFGTFYNVNRDAYANINDESKAVSEKTDAQKTRSIAALRNSYTPGTFVFLEDDVTVKINGKDTTYPKGTYYGKIMQDQLDADGVAIKVWDPTADGGIGSSDGFDGWYNVDNARKELKTAIEELKKIGVEVTKDNPTFCSSPWSF